jgi:hypothetical protein
MTVSKDFGNLAVVPVPQHSLDLVVSWAIKGGNRLTRPFTCARATLATPRGLHAAAVIVIAVI